ncbi:ADP-heptosyltransferase [Bacteroidota bacterium]|nr:ADP-heptosyltransferase [Bacteroidota bacterium]
MNGIVRLGGKLFGINHNLNRDFKTIAICKFKGIGSIIQATPLILTLKKKYPEAKIIFVTTKSHKKFLKLIPVVDEIISLDDSSGTKLITSFFPFIIKLITRKIEVYIDLEIYSHFSTLVTTLSLARNRFGYYLRSSQYRMGCNTHMLFYNIQHPIAQTYLQFARLLGCTEIENQLWNFNNISENDFSENELLKNFSLKSYLLINPNASDLRLERRWPSESFIKLIDRISERFPDLHIGIIGSANEIEYVEQLISKVSKKNNLLNLAGKTSLPELISLIRNANLFVTNDTGPMHIAMATNTATIALFGPCSPNQYGNHSKVKSIYRNVYCSPCVHEFEIPPCKGNNVCMQMITVKEIYEVFEKSLDEKFLRDTISTDTIIYTDGKNTVLGLVKRS